MTRPLGALAGLAVAVLLAACGAGDAGPAATADGTLVGKVSSSREVQLAAQRARFTAVPARGEAGLYRQITGSPGKPGYRESGWIVLADASARGSTQFTSTDTDLVVGPAPKRTRTARPVTSFTSNESDF